MMNRDVAIRLKGKDASSGAFSSIRKRFESMKKYIDRGFDIGKKLAVGALASGGALAILYKRSIEAGDAIGKLRDRTGISAQLLSKLQYAAEQSDASLGDIAKSAKKLGEGMIDALKGTADMQYAFAKLGVSIRDTNGEIRPLEDVLLDVADGMEKLPDGAMKAWIANKLLGKGGTTLLPMFKSLRSEMKDAEKYTFIWSDATTDAATLIGDNFTRIYKIAGSFADRFAVKLSPSIQKIQERIIGWYEANKQLIDSKAEEWAERLGEKILVIADRIGNAIDAWSEWLGLTEGDKSKEPTWLMRMVDTIKDAVKTAWDYWVPMVTDLAAKVMKQVTSAWESMLIAAEELIDRIQPIIDAIAMYTEGGSLRGGERKAVANLQKESRRWDQIKADNEAREMNRAIDLSDAARKAGIVRPRFLMEITKLRRSASDPTSRRLMDEFEQQNKTALAKVQGKALANLANETTANVITGVVSGFRQSLDRRDNSASLAYAAGGL